MQIHLFHEVTIKAPRKGATSAGATHSAGGPGSECRGMSLLPHPPEDMRGHLVKPSMHVAKPSKM